mmetsp:Transcript_113/g.252  ORF Transcript_113/g.252 Transcript_113/m.252 type:complete len:130 (+) Transcript_113:1078-1467(+)
MFSQALEIVATNGWLITLCGLSIYFVIASGFLTAKSSLSAPKPSISQRQHLLEVRERQQAQAEEARKAAGEEKVGRKTTVGQAFAKIEEREKRKKIIQRQWRIQPSAGAAREWVSTHTEDCSERMTVAR